MKYKASPSVNVFGEKIEKAWGLKEWQGWQDPDQDVLFFGMYEKQDYKVFHAHEGKKTIFWCGSDILYLFGNPERVRIVMEDPTVEHWVETEVQASMLARVDIRAKIAPSFLEDINEFPLSFKATDKPHVWMSGHPNREEEYGFDTAKRMAVKFPQITFHLYGVEKNDDRTDCPENVIYHGWVSNKQLNEDIKNYQGCIRANQHDGFSEVPAKTMLLGGYAMTYLPYKYAWMYRSEEELAELLQRLTTTTTPNKEASEYYRQNLNNYPWVSGYQEKDIKNIYELQGIKMYLDLQEENPILRETFQAYAYHGFHEQATTELFRQTVKEGDTILDLGANIGYFTMIGAKLTGDKGEVYSFEPEPANFKYLNKNIEINGFKNVVAKQMAVTDKKDKAKLFICPYDSGHHTLNQFEGISSYRPVPLYSKEEFVEVDTTSMDDFFGDKKIDIVKMDVEGCEVKALRGMKNIIKKHKPKMFIEFFPLLIKKMGDSPEELVKILLDNYSVFIVPHQYNSTNDELLHIKSFDELMANCRHEKAHLNLFVRP